MNKARNDVTTVFARVFLPILLVCATIAVYWQVSHHGFISYDDPSYVTENPHVQKGLTLGNVIWAFTTLSSANWHPLTWLSHMIDYDLFGLSPAGHHLMNLFFHVVNTLLLFLLLSYATGKYYQSMFVAALFALHPLHIQSVAWVAERKDLLCALFWIVALILYSVYVKRRSRAYYSLAVAAFALGLMAKPMLVTLPLVLLLWDYWPLGRFGTEGAAGLTPGQDGRRKTFLLLLMEKIPFALLSAASSAVTYYAQQSAGATVPVKAWSVASRLINSALAYTGYMAKMFWPVNLSIIYPLPYTVPVMQGLLACFFLAGISVAVSLSAARRHAYLLVGWLWYLVTLVPVIGIVQVGQQAMADRYTYMPLVGLFIVISWGLPELMRNYARRRLILSVSATLVLLALTVSTWQQLSYWQDSITLFRHAAEAVPRNNVAYRILGNNLAKEGYLDRAIPYLSEAVAIDPNDWVAHTDLGVALASRNMTREAAYQYEAALSLNPDFANAHYNLGILLAGMGRYEEAVHHYEETLRIEPSRVDARANLGAALYKEGKTAEAIVVFRDALLMEPGNAGLNYYLARALATQGEKEESIDYFRRALAIDPNFVAARRDMEELLSYGGKVRR